MKCFQCDNDIVDESKMILVSADGDFVCSEKCRKAHEAGKARFFNDIVHSSEKTAAYLSGR